MKTRYLTYVLRLRLDDNHFHASGEDQVSGSVQQVGEQEIHYFDSLEKLQQALQQYVGRSALRYQAHIDKREGSKNRESLQKI